MDRLAALRRHLCASSATPAPTGQPDPSPSSRVWRGGSPAPSPAHLGRWPEAEKDPEWPWEMATRFDLSPSPHAAALIVIDMQAGDMVIESPATPSQHYWNTRIQEVIPRIERMLRFFRGRGMPVLHTRNGSITPHGRESAERLRDHTGHGSSPLENDRYRGRPNYEITPELFPAEDELVVDKLTSSAFHASMLDHALRNMGVEDVVLVGCLTDMCVLGTARGAAELGYNTLVVDDATATLTQRAHDEGLLVFARTFGRVAFADDLLEELAHFQAT